MRNKALAMVAPVLPALTMAQARPSRTASAARTNVESFLVRTLWAGSSFIAMTSEAGSTSSPPVSPREPSVGPTKHDGDPQLLGRASRPGHDLGRGTVSSHGVNSDRQRSGRRRRHTLFGGRRHDGQLTSTAWRPLYHPQCGHTTCGSFARLH